MPNLHDLPHYFNIGQFVSVLSVSLVILQWTRPIYRFRLSSRIGEQWFIGALLSIAIVFLCVVTAAVLPFVPAATKKGLLTYTIFWELLGGFEFVVVILYFSYSALVPVEFTARNSQAYAIGCTRIIQSGEEEALRDIAEELVKSFPAIFRTVESFAERQRVADREHRICEPTLFERDAIAILTVLSDSTFCRQAITRIPKFAIAFMEQVKAHDRPLHIIGAECAHELMHQAFSQPSSILARERTFRGLGWAGQFRKAVFGAYPFVEAGFRPLQAWRTYETKNIEPWQVEAYGECLNMALQAYLGPPMFRGRPLALNVGLSSLTYKASEAVMQLTHYSGPNVYMTAEFKSLSHIAGALRSMIDVVKEHHRDVQSIDPIDGATYKRGADETIFGTLAGALFDYYAAISNATTHEDAIRVEAISLWLHLCDVNGNKDLSLAQRAITSRLFTLLNKAVGDNFRIPRPQFPPITRVLISLLGFRTFPHIDPESTEGRFRMEFHEVLRARFADLYAREKKTALRLLPDGYKFDDNAILQVVHEEVIDRFELI